MILYGLKTCDTCRNALKALEAAGHDVTFRDVRAAPLAPEDIARFHEVFGDALINRASTTWRGLDDAARNDDPKALLAAHPTLMKRPLIDTDAKLYLGWKADVQTALI